MNHNYHELYGGFIKSDLQNLKFKYKQTLPHNLEYEITNLANILVNKIKELKKELDELDKKLPRS